MPRKLTAPEPPFQEVAVPQRPVSLTAPRGSVAADVVREGIDALLAPAADDLPLGFPADALAEAEQAAARSLGDRRRRRGG